MSATVWTKAALGEKGPATPPDSFQPLTTPLTVSARSWLYPALDVHRSAFALKIALELTFGVRVIESLVLSMSVQVAPSLPVRLYCIVDTAAQRSPINVNRSAGLVSDVPPGVVTVTSATPGQCAGDAAVIDVAELTTTLAAGKPPKLTLDVGVKFVPVILPGGPPASGPLLGLTLTTVGGGT